MTRLIHKKDRAARKTYKFTIIILFCLIKQIDVQSQDSVKKILVVGNSVMFYNNMPANLLSLLSETNNSYVLQDCSKGGSSLTRSLNTKYISSNKGFDVRDFNDSLKVESSINDTLRKKWDWVILQEQSSYILYKELYKHITINTVNGYKELIERDNPDCSVILFENYSPKKIGKKLISTIRRPVCLDSAEMVKVNDSLLTKLTDNYYSLECTTDSLETLSSVQQVYFNRTKNIARSNDFNFAPTGQIHFLLKSTYPSWKMYRIAGHPSRKASFMFACVYYEMITKKDVTKTKFTGKISNKKARIIKEMVHSYLLNNPVEY